MQVDSDAVGHTLRDFVTRARGLDEGAIDSGTPLIEERILDSMLVFEIASFIEDEFGVVVPDEQLVPSTFETIDALAAVVISLQETDGA